MKKMIDWKTFKKGHMAIELDNEADILEFLEMAKDEGIKLAADPGIYVDVVINDKYKYFIYTPYNTIGVKNNVDLSYEEVIYYRDIFTGNLPSKESLMEFLNGGS